MNNFSDENFKTIDLNGFLKCEGNGKKAKITQIMKLKTSLNVMQVFLQD